MTALACLRTLLVGKALSDPGINCLDMSGDLIFVECCKLLDIHAGEVELLKGSYLRKALIEKVIKAAP